MADFEWPPRGGSGGGSGTLTSIAGTKSIISTPNPITITGTFELVGDAASPGNSQYYGTDGAGAKGYHALPAGSGDIKSDGSVNFIATEKWDNGAGTNTQISTSQVITSNTGTQKAASINNDGSLILSDNTTIKSESDFYATRIVLDVGAVTTLFSRPVRVIPLRPGYATEIITAFARWSAGGTHYDGITNALYFFTATTTDNQFQIGCPGPSVSPNMQRGRPVEVLAKNNIEVSQDVFVTTDADSTIGDSTLTLYLYWRYTFII